MLNNNIIDYHRFLTYLFFTSIYIYINIKRDNSVTLDSAKIFLRIMASDGLIYIHLQSLRIYIYIDVLCIKVLIAHIIVWFCTISLTPYSNVYFKENIKVCSTTIYNIRVNIENNFRSIYVYCMMWMHVYYVVSYLICPIKNADSTMFFFSCDQRHR